MPWMNEAIKFLSLSVFLLGGRSQILVEPIQRALPCELGSGFVIRHKADITIAPCLLSGVKRTFASAAAMSADDP